MRRFCLAVQWKRAKKAKKTDFYRNENTDNLLFMCPHLSKGLLKILKTMNYVHGQSIRQLCRS